jgi:hypothetical protein
VVTSLLQQPQASGPLANQANQHTCRAGRAAALGRVLSMNAPSWLLVYKIFGTVHFAACHILIDCALLQPFHPGFAYCHFTRGVHTAISASAQAYKWCMTAYMLEGAHARMIATLFYSTTVF